MCDDFTIGMAGSGGDGIVSAGEAILHAAATAGYHGMLTKSFGPQIRGGESSCRLRLSTRPVPNPGGALDVAIALNWDDFLRFGAELPTDGHSIVIYEEATGVAPEAVPLKPRPVAAVAVPIAAIAHAHGGDKAKNTVVLGLVSTWFGLAGEAILAGMRKKLAKKGPAVVAGAEQAFAAGAAFAAEHPLAAARRMAPAADHGRVWLADGNDLCAAAAIVAGCEFFSGYPITPSSEIMHALARDLWAYGGAVIQTEDEIAAIGAAVGASYGGRKAMTATSGPGLSLKTEMIGLATIAELPLVIVNIQRGGPATGIPGKSEQADLFQAAFSAHGDAVRPVLAPTGVADTFATTLTAFNIAEEFQTPVIILGDQEISQRKETMVPIDTAAVKLVDRVRPSSEALAAGYKRFRLEANGISPISQPGMAGGEYLASGLEHDESGAPASGGANHLRMSVKRATKFAPLLARQDLVRIEGDPDAEIALISWGSTAGIAREAMAIAGREGMKVKLLAPMMLYPVSTEIIGRFLAGVTRGLVVEQSYLGQYYRMLRAFVELPPAVRSFCRPAAIPFSAQELVAELRGRTERSAP